MSAVAEAAVETLCEAVRAADRVLPHGAHTKPAASRSTDADVVALDVAGLRGIVEYDPAELTLTAQAGTPVAELAEALADHGQYLPFDPPFLAAGATLGGVVATGASGPNALRHGGVRDAVIGVSVIDGTGRLVRGGGRVVKNAAGFDLPKLMVGSLGRLGVIVSVSLKVLPAPAQTVTVRAELGDLGTALEAAVALARGPVALDALELEPGGRITARIGGDPASLAGRAERCRAAIGADRGEILRDGDDAGLWRELAELAWVPAGARAVRVPITAARLRDLDAALAVGPALAVRYGLAATVAWIAWPKDVPLSGLGDVLAARGLAGVVLTGDPVAPLIGAGPTGPFAERIRGALDPHDRFPALR